MKRLGIPVPIGSVLVPFVRCENCSISMEARLNPWGAGWVYSHPDYASCVASGKVFEATIYRLKVAKKTKPK
jgi:hypothetical protein